MQPFKLSLYLPPTEMAVINIIIGLQVALSTSILQRLSNQQLVVLQFFTIIGIGLEVIVRGIRGGCPVNKGAILILIPPNMGIMYQQDISQDSER